MTTAWMFPGQGSQREGMALDLEVCRELVPAAREVAGAEIERLLLAVPNSSWPPALLQPALFVVCVGAARALDSRGLAPGAVVGHSLGEYAALVAAGALGAEDALRVVAVRGRAMEAAGRANPGGMAAVIGLDAGVLEGVCAEAGDVWLANLNTPAQTVVSGRADALARVAELAREAGARRVIRLDVPVAAHCPLMETAAAAVAEALAGLTVRPPAAPFWSVVDALPHDEPDEIRDLLVRAVTSPVRFAATVTAMHAGGVDAFVEVGPGRVLSGLVKQTLPGVALAAAGTDAEAEDLASLNHRTTTDGAASVKIPDTSLGARITGDTAAARGGIR